MPRTALFIFAVVLLAAMPVMAQPAFDAQSSNAYALSAGTPTATLSHTTAVTTNRILLVAVHLNVRPDTDVLATNVTYGGNALTQLAGLYDAGLDTRTEVWYLLNPPVGTSNVIVTLGNIGSTIDTLVSATTFSNVNQAAPAGATAFGNGGPASVTVTGTTTTDLVLDFVTARENVTLTAGGSQTPGYNSSTGGTNDDLQAAASGRLGASGSTAMSWTLSPNRRWTQIGVALQTAAADVEITKAATPDPVLAGQSLTYTMRVTNNGPSSATGVQVVDTLPAAVTYVSANTTQGSCSGTGPVTCTIGTMASGQSVTVTITVTAPNTPGLIANNTATVSSTTSDTGASNTATATAYVLASTTSCQTQPGKDGAGGTLAGTINAYWPGTANAAAGATSITVGTRRGAATSITAGDLVLIIQMQDAAMDSNNDDRYGSGVGITGGTTNAGSGYSSLNNAGRYEYAVATNTVGAAGGTLTIASGLTYAYTNAAATVTQGQRRFQVVRVPQYTSATLGGTLTASAWNGTTGGILAFDVAGDLALGSTTVNVNGLGFRGGGPRQLAGGGTATNTDYRNTAAQNAHGIKGEGIAGTPEWVLDSGAALDVGPQGYPNGDYGRGAPGNAGGGGTDGNPSTNDENSGGGGGANWGAGGRGGNTWNSNLQRGGFGGSSFYASPGRVVLGGGGGAGARNNSSGTASSGAAGGGIVLIRAGRMTGTGTITANGSNATNVTSNDGGGGGGAGGSIVVLSYGGGIGGLTLQANGGTGGNAWSTQAPGGTPGDRHGPGGGGGGGYIATNGTPASTSVTGAAQGITTTANDTYGATGGSAGTVVTSATFDQITGVDSGCVDLSVTLADSPDPVFAGNNLTYTIAVTNNATNVPAQTPSISLTLPSGTTFVSMTPPPGWSCTTPAVGGTGSVSCSSSNPLAAGASSGNFSLVVDTDEAATDGSTLSETVTTATANPESNTSNNSDSENTTVNRRVDIAVTKETNDDGSDDAFQEGETLIYTITVTNNGPSRATNVVVTDPLPSGFTFVSVSPSGPTCTHSSGTVTCTYAAMNNGASNVITITGTISVNTTQLVNTATATRTETDTDSSNDSDTATVFVLAPTLVKMLTFSAERDRNGKVSIQWTTSFEADNLGFNVYRETGGVRERINKHLIAGSAFLKRRGTLESGGSYRWKDKLRAGETAQYWIEDVDLNTTRTLHGPIAPLLSTSDLPDEANTDTLADLGTAPGGIFESPRGIGAPRASSARPVLAQQWELASQPAVKLMVTEEGWYRVTRAELMAAGFDAADTKKLALFADGVEQPIAVDGDAIEFYGTGLDTAWTGARAYWLVQGKGRALRVKRSNLKKGGAALTSTPYTLSHAERTFFTPAIVTNGERENFYGPVVWAFPGEVTLNVEHVDARGDAQLELVLQGATEAPHIVSVEMNGARIGEARLTMQERITAKLSLPASSLREGANALKLTAMGGDFDVTAVESIRLTYPHRLIADNDALRTVASAGMTVSVSGFSSANVRALDVTDPLQPIALDVHVEGNTATVIAPETGERTILFAGESRVLPPAQIVPSRASTLNDTRNAADLVILTTRAFATAVEPLAARRTSEGLKTSVIDVQDVYDEFGYGHRGPEAIRDFLKHTSKWSTAPRYVLLVGDASYDSRNYLGYGSFDFIPTRLISTRWMKTASDEWLAPHLAVGRLPARTAAEVEAMVAKILAPAGGEKNAAFVADHAPDFDFNAAAQSLAAAANASWTTSTTNAPTPNVFDAQIVTYLGHGSIGLWSAGGFDSDDASQLTNRRPAVVAAMTCLNGFFFDLFMPALAESLMTNSNGGASAVWASSTLTPPAGQVQAARELVRQLTNGARLGDAVLTAKHASSDPDVRTSWILFGDPSMPMR